MKGIFKNKKVKKKSGEIEMEEIFLDNFLEKQKENLEIFDKRLEIPLTKQILYLFLFFSFLLIGVLWISCFRFQITKGEDYKILSEKNKFAVLKIQASRGVIYDRNLEQLVWNQSSFDLILDESQLPEEESEREEIIKEVSKIIGSDIEIESVLVAENLPYQTLISLEAEIEKFPGFFIKESSIRKYKDYYSLAHILGYMGKIKASELEECQECSILDFVGREGLENSYEKILREKKGKIQIERTAEGKEISREIVEYPDSGNSLILTLDLSLQEKIEQILTETLEEIGSQGGAAVALDPRQGNVLASVSLPSFDNNLFAQGIKLEELQKLNEDKRNPQVNRVISGLYPIGSTIKPLIGSAALEEGIIKETTQLYCPLDLCLENIYTKEKECFSDWKFHGLSKIKRAIAESINPFFYMIGGGYDRPGFADSRLPKHFKGLGIEKIKEYLKLFGLGEKTKIDLPGESRGRVPDQEWKENYFANQPRAEQIWYLGDTYNLSIGQGYLLTTPLQIASAFSAIANGGVLYQPKIVDKIINSEKELVEERKSEIIRKDFINLANLEIIRQGMKQAVTSPVGSAFRLNSLPVEVAAKTGTAQIGLENIYQNWITVFAPYDNPEIVLTIVIEKVEGMRITSQKVAQEVLEWYFDENK
jgi:penicillin-binding protein 2